MSDKNNTELPKPAVQAGHLEHIVSFNDVGFMVGVKAAMQDLEDFTNAADVAFTSLGVALYDLACAEYRKYHTRMPGSNSTKRLKKKRSRAVSNWFCKHVSNAS